MKSSATLDRIGATLRRWCSLGKRACEQRWCLPVVLLVAFGLRLWHLLALRSTVWFDHLDLDPAYFDELGKRIASGQWTSSRPFFVDALYPHFLGTVYAVFGHTLLVVRLLQLAVGVGTVALVAVVGRSIASRAVGNVAAMIQALFAPAIFAEMEIEKTALATFFLAAAVTLAIRRRSYWTIAAGGGLLGLSALCRGNVALLVVPIVWYLGREDHNWRPRAAAVFVTGMLIVAAPVLLHNQATGGGWTLTSSMGQNFYQGNNDFNSSGSYGVLPFVRSSPEFEEADFRAEAERRVGRSLEPGEVSDYWWGQAWAHIRNDPWLAARAIEHKVELVLNDYEVPDNQDFYLVADFSPVLRWLPLSFGVLLPFAFIGAVVSWRQRPARLIVVLVLSYLASVVAFFVVGRFRLTVMPLVAVTAALGVRWVVRQVSTPTEPRSVAFGAMAFISLVFVAFHPPRFHDRDVNTALAWRNLGSLQSRVGTTEAAIAAYRHALDIQPQSELLHTELAVVFIDAGQLDNAEAELTRAISHDEGIVDTWILLGEIYEGTGRNELAIDAYHRALELDPTAQDVRDRLVSLSSPG
jgi:4-amino-4-deoxy-L-arabinose transferase-like glycosyltransferase